MKKVIAIVLALISVLAVFTFTGCADATKLEESLEEKFEEFDETEIVTFEATVMKLDMEMYHVDGLGARTRYYASVKSDDFIKVVEISEEQYVLLNIGDIVTINIENSKLNGQRISVEMH